ncbi:MAG: T9SS type A sorting domain-containing protein [Bacteroidota bacterium]|nr:T9SS type A sorting domain-containing protein [Bacteroidota bacterium]
MRNLKSFLLLIVILMSLHVKGQIPFYEDSLQVLIEDSNTGVFHTQGDSLIVSNNFISNKIFSDFKVYLMKQEFPTAITPYLLKVYIMVCDCNVEILMDTLKKHETIFGAVYRIGIGQVTGNKSISTNTGKTTIFPNPFQKEIFINKIDKDDFNYELVNIFGVRIKTGKLSKTENRLNLSSLEQGTYLRKLKSEKSKVETYKIIKE